MKIFINCLSLNVLKNFLSDINKIYFNYFNRKFPMHFNEDLMFKDDNAKSLKREFTERFLNVTRIIDCVTCEKCRLWGKLQVKF